MSHWRKKEDELTELFTCLLAEPGQNVSELARELEVATSTITRRLPNLDEVGLLLYEDDEGRLYPFDPDA